MQEYNSGSKGCSVPEANETRNLTLLKLKLFYVPIPRRVATSAEILYPEGIVRNNKEERTAARLNHSFN